MKIHPSITKCTLRKQTLQNIRYIYIHITTDFFRKLTGMRTSYKARYQENIFAVAITGCKENVRIQFKAME